MLRCCFWKETGSHSQVLPFIMSICHIYIMNISIPHHYHVHYHHYHQYGKYHLLFKIIASAMRGHESFVNMNSWYIAGGLYCTSLRPSCCKCPWTRAWPSFSKWWIPSRKRSFFELKVDGKNVNLERWTLNPMSSGQKYIWFWLLWSFLSLMFWFVRIVKKPCLESWWRL